MDENSLKWNLKNVVHVVNTCANKYISKFKNTLKIFSTYNYFGISTRASLRTGSHEQPRFQINT